MKTIAILRPLIPFSLATILFVGLINTSALAQTATNLASDELKTTIVSASNLIELHKQPRESRAKEDAPRNWPSFLGRGATQLNPSMMPTDWSHQKNVQWKTELVGGGQSSPVIWDKTVFVSSIDGTMKEQCVVTALSLENGNPVWTYKTPSSQPVRSNYYQSRSAPTPVVDQDRVYTLFETGKLIALDHKGEQIWTRSLTDDYGAFEVRIGLAASLAQTKDHVIAMVDHEGPSYLLAVDKQTGKTAWKTERFSRQSYSSPIILTIAGEPQIVCSSDGSVDGYDVTTGEQLWTFEEVGGNRATTPLPIADGVFLISASPGMHGEYSEDAKASNLVMRVDREGDDFKPSVVWRTERAMPSFASPIVYQGLAYWVTGTGILYCFDANNGEQVYKQRLGQRCWATPLGVGDRIYFFGKDGTTKVLASGNKFNIIAENELIEGGAEAGLADIKRREEREKRNKTAASGKDSGKQHASSERDRSRTDRDGVSFAEPIQYGYAAVNGSLVIRTGSHVFCIREDSDKEKSQGSAASNGAGE